MVGNLALLLAFSPDLAQPCPPWVYVWCDPAYLLPWRRADAGRACSHSRAPYWVSPHASR